MFMVGVYSYSSSVDGSTLVVTTLGASLYNLMEEFEERYQVVQVCNTPLCTSVKFSGCATIWQPDWKPLVVKHPGFGC